MGCSAEALPRSAIASQEIGSEKRAYLEPARSVKAPAPSSVVGVTLSAPLMTTMFGMMEIFFGALSIESEWQHGAASLISLSTSNLYSLFGVNASIRLERPNRPVGVSPLPRYLRHPSRLPTRLPPQDEADISPTGIYFTHATAHTSPLSL